MAHVYEASVSYHDFQGNFMQNVFHFELAEAGAGTPFDYADALCTALQGSIESDLQALLGTDCTIDFYQAKKVTGGGGPSATLISAAAGTNAQNSSSSVLAFDVAWMSASPTNRPGHTFLAGVPVGAITGGQWQAGYLTLVDNFINDMLNTLVLAGGLGNADFGLYSRKLNQFNKITKGIKKPKPTAMNKRSLPII